MSYFSDGGSFQFANCKRWPGRVCFVFWGPPNQQMGVSENVVYLIVPNGFADHYPYEKWLAIIGNINPTFSDKPIYG